MNRKCVPFADTRTRETRYGVIVKTVQYGADGTVIGQKIRGWKYKRPLSDPFEIFYGLNNASADRRDVVKNAADFVKAAQTHGLSVGVAWPK